MQKANGDLVPGGLAMVIGCNFSSEDIGKIVTTVEHVKAGHISPDGLRYAGVEGWFCESDQITCLRTDGSKGGLGFGYYSSCHLMPINPESDPMHVSEREKCTND